MSDDYWGKPEPEWVEAYEKTGYVSCDILHPGSSCISETISMLSSKQA